MKKNWLAIISIALNIVLLLFVRNLGGQVESLRGAVQQIERQTERVISRDIESLRSEIQQAQKLHTDYALEPAGLDAKSKSLLADAFVELKSWSEDTQVTLLVTQSGQESDFPMTHEGQGRFTAPVALQVENGEVRLAACITTAGVTTREELGGWGEFFMLLPLQMSSWGWGDPSFDKGILTLTHHSVSLRDRVGNTVPAQDTEFYLYINGEKIETVGVKAEDLDVYGYEFETHTLTHPVQVGDRLSVSFACRDEYGLHYEFPLYTWDVVETKDQNSFTAAGGDTMPILTWE